jgi:acetyltransferase-like isoleucine patch superfamily enzyme
MSNNFLEKIMHNLTEESWEKQRHNIEPWSVDSSKMGEQKQIQKIISKLANAEIGHNCYIAGDCNFFTSKAKLGNSVKIASLATLRGHITLGNDVSINPYANLVGKINVGNAVRIASAVQIFGFNHGFSRVDRYIKDQPITSEGITIAEGCWIGAGATILDGVSIGRHSIVAAGAVVTKSFGDFSIIGGNPARLLKSRIKPADKKIKLDYLTKRNDVLDFCIDIPITSYIDENRPQLNGWIASSEKIEDLFIETLNTSYSLVLNNDRHDVKLHLEKFRPTLFKKAKIYGFSIPQLLEQQKICAKINSKIINLCKLSLS